MRFLDARSEGGEGAGDPIAAAVERLVAGELLAVKGVGGFEVIGNAASAAALYQLRRLCDEREPLALMVADAESASTLCDLTPAEARLLSARESPIVLPRSPLRAGILAEGVEITLHSGSGAPSTPLQYLLLRAFADAIAPQRPVALAVVMAATLTEPILRHGNEALAALLPLAGSILTDNRTIATACHSSIARVVAGDVQLMRRSRGYTPLPIALPVKCRYAAACVWWRAGERLRAGRWPQAFVSQYIGDLARPGVQGFAREALDHFQRLFHLRPAVVAYDAAPGVPQQCL